MAEGGAFGPTYIELQPLLPLLPLRGRVLLPSSVLRVVLASPRSIQLVETHLWGRKERGEIFVGVVPLLKNADGSEALHNIGTVNLNATDFTVTFSLSLSQL